MDRIEAEHTLGGIVDKDGIVVRWPKKAAEKEAVLWYLQSKFEPGRRYSEREVNELLKRWHAFGDHALLRRELFDHFYLNRTADCTQYWREVPMAYRHATEADVQRLCDIVPEAISEMERHGIFQWDEQYPTREDIARDETDGSLFVGTSDGEIAVFYTLNQETDAAYDAANWQYRGSAYCVIHRLCVSPRFQQKKIAQQTLLHIEQELRAQGIRAIRLDVFCQNPFALRLYRHAGYRETGTATWRKGQFLLMEKLLEEEAPR